MSDRLHGNGVLLGFLLVVPSLAAEEEPRPQTPAEQYEALINEYEAANAKYSKSLCRAAPARQAVESRTLASRKTRSTCQAPGGL